MNIIETNYPCWKVGKAWAEEGHYKKNTWCRFSSETHFSQYIHLLFLGGGGLLLLSLLYYLNRCVKLRLTLENACGKAQCVNCEWTGKMALHYQNWQTRIKRINQIKKVIWKFSCNRLIIFCCLWYSSLKILDTCSSSEKTCSFISISSLLSLVQMDAI